MTPSRKFPRCLILLGLPAISRSSWQAGRAAYFENPRNDFVFTPAAEQAQEVPSQLSSLYQLRNNRQTSQSSDSHPATVHNNLHDVYNRLMSPIDYDLNSDNVPHGPVPYFGPNLVEPQHITLEETQFLSLQSSRHQTDQFEKNEALSQGGEGSSQESKKCWCKKRMRKEISSLQTPHAGLSFRVDSVGTAIPDTSEFFQAFPIYKVREKLISIISTLWGEHELRYLDLTDTFTEQLETFQKDLLWSGLFDIEKAEEKMIWTSFLMKKVLVNIRIMLFLFKGRDTMPTVIEAEVQKQQERAIFEVIKYWKVILLAEKKAPLSQEDARRLEILGDYEEVDRVLEQFYRDAKRARKHNSTSWMLTRIWFKLIGDGKTCKQLAEREQKFKVQLGGIILAHGVDTYVNAKHIDFQIKKRIQSLDSLPPSIRILYWNVDGGPLPEKRLKRTAW
ncbi:hypothetical protein O181_012567 [Austropuccinia psidii MF-1]|uniref:Uncharacterized protein n=1 Tax=Austropuccinia psidii MF-1 TaxID=1389203 RepID=A0A9Q3BWP3_9BASI|nr:hypothetical protein [Austropuccinia psidii MF-1]